jgi:hypothetical protein
MKNIDSITIYGQKTKCAGSYISSNILIRDAVMRALGSFVHNSYERDTIQENASNVEDWVKYMNSLNYQVRKMPLLSVYEIEPGVFITAVLNNGDKIGPENQLAFIEVDYLENRNVFTLEIDGEKINSDDLIAQHKDEIAIADILHTSKDENITKVEIYNSKLIEVYYIIHGNYYAEYENGRSINIYFKDTMLEYERITDETR